MSAVERVSVQDATAAETGPSETASLVSLTADRPTARGKFLYVGDDKLTIRGVTYGAFRPDAHGAEYQDLSQVDRDFASIAAAGFNVVRIPHTTPPRALLDVARRHNLLVMVGLSVEHYIGYLLDRPITAARRIEHELRERVRTCFRHPALLCYSLGNEIPASIVRLMGPARIEKFLRQMCDAVHDEDPEALVTYVNYPTTEYLDLSFLDLISMNVYLEDRETLAGYLARLQNLAGERPLLLSEVGLDSMRNGTEAQALTMDWQIRTAFTSGCVGVIVFSWTDEWYRAGEDVTDWAFGLTDEERQPKPALAAVQRAFAAADSPVPPGAPSISVVLCSYNGSRTIGEAIDGLVELDYPDFEIIVVDDGSTDATAELADRPGVRLIRAEHGGLSKARNIGLESARGEIVAYIDDDAYPDRDWLTNLSHAFMTTEHAGIGGPNISPPSDGPMHQCVSNSPGNPSHVLIDDVEAEHIPGCNMAFRREHLNAIGGFDVYFQTAGDDVDVCWRLREAGYTLGYAPAAVVWHHRRGSIRAYMRQQIGYGRAESMLGRKWGHKQGNLLQFDWHGTIYGGGHTRPLTLRRPRVYHGTWGRAPFQSLYRPQASTLSSFLLAPEVYLPVAALAFVSGLGAILWKPLLWALLPLGLAVGALVAQAVISARHATFPKPTLAVRRRSVLVATTAMLHLLQPMARLRGRLRTRSPRARLGRTFGVPLPTKRTLWTADWQPEEQWPRRLEAGLEQRGAPVSRGSGHDRWDLEVHGGILGSARSCMAAEDHKDRHQLVRVRSWPQMSRLAMVFVWTLGVLFVLAALDGEWLGATVFGTSLTATVAVTLLQCSAAMGAFRSVLANDGFTRRSRRSRRLRERPDVADP